MAIDRVAKRELYIPICDNWFVIDNMDLSPEVIAEGSDTLGKEIFNNEISSCGKVLMAEERAINLKDLRADFRAQIYLSLGNDFK